MSTTTTTTAVRDLLAAHAAAHAAREPERIMALYSANPVTYTLAPPLQQGPDTEYGTIDGLRRWMDTFDGPIRIDYQDPVVTAAGDVAFVHTLTRMTATPAGAPESFSFWFRSTFGLRRQEDGWRIVHRHESTPFHMDGSFRAAVDLLP
ncbi:MAG TPA: nuclear transport factor 2 family protein [Streptosporangiaceae bacterium]|jgi:ketosteroid isomerase-like protein|nr:nuclear transport factor 2 family protein [Streptosporangiaceae bacterium]